MTDSNGFKKILAAAVLSETTTAKAKKSTGVKIATQEKNIPVTVIQPFSR